jgi:excisionase family DNA binding protein
MTYTATLPNGKWPNIDARISTPQIFVLKGQIMKDGSLEIVCAPTAGDLSAEVFVTASEAGDFLELHPATVQRFAREGLIPAHPVAGEKRRRWRFLRSELAEWLRARTGEKRITA